MHSELQPRHDVPAACAGGLPYPQGFPQPVVPSIQETGPSSVEQKDALVEVYRREASEPQAGKDSLHGMGGQKLTFHSLLSTLADDLHDLLKGLAAQGETIAAKNLDLTAQNELLQGQLYDLVGHQKSQQAIKNPAGESLAVIEATGSACKARVEELQRETNGIYSPPTIHQSAGRVDAETQTEVSSILPLMETPSKLSNMDTILPTRACEIDVLPHEMQDALDSIRSGQENTLLQISQIFNSISSHYTRDHASKPFLDESDSSSSDSEDENATFQIQEVTGIDQKQRNSPCNVCEEHLLENRHKEVTIVGRETVTTPPLLGQNAWHRNRFKTTDDLSKKAWDNEFGISTCPFLSAQGKVTKPPGDWDEIFDALRKVFRVKATLRKRESCGTRFVNSKFFMTLSLTVITLNFIVMIWQTDWKMGHIHDDDPLSFSIIGYSFTAYYVFECGIQIIIKGRAYFSSDEWHWSVFDCIIVSVSVVELVVKSLGGSAMNMSFLRALRFLRISKLLRMFQALRMFKEIRLMVDMLAGSFTFFIWCTMMLALFLSLFAIFFVQGISSYLEATPDLDPATKDRFQNEFGNVGQAMLTLFMAASGGNDWQGYYEIIDLLGPQYRVLWVFFILFAMMAFFNIIGGVFCEKAMALARPTLSEVMLDRKAKDVRDATELSMLLNKNVDHKETYRVDHEQFDSLLEVAEVQTYFEVRGMSIASARRFFNLLLRVFDRQYIEFGTLISAFVKLDGIASSIDLQVVQVELKSLQQEHAQLLRLAKENALRMCQLVS